MNVFLWIKEEIQARREGRRIRLLREEQYNKEE